MWATLSTLNSSYLPHPFRGRPVCPAFTLEGLVCGEEPALLGEPWLCVTHQHLEAL